MPSLQRASERQRSLISADFVQTPRALGHLAALNSTRASADASYSGLVPQPQVPYFWPKVALSGAVVGGVFGVMGAGASMVMKPLLYYVFKQQPFKRTIFEMYLILIILASLGAARGHLRGRVAWRHVGILSLCTSGLGTAGGAFLARLVSSDAQLLCFAGLVVLVSAHMWHEASKAGAPKPSAAAAPDGPAKGPPALAAHEALELTVTCTVSVAVGVLSGFVGVGGGFMLTPLLCHLGHSMETAVPTSLAVIAVSAIMGSLWYAWLFGMQARSVDAALVASLAGAGCVGLLLSDSLGSRVSKVGKQRGFALLLLAISVGVLRTQVLAPMGRSS